MGLQLKSIEDARSSLEQCSRKECEYIGRLNNIKELDPSMPKPLMISILKNHGITKFTSLAHVQLGSIRPMRTPPYDEWVRMVTGGVPRPQEPEEVEAVEMTAEELMMAEWKSRRPPQHEFSQEEIFAHMPLFELRKVCKLRGVDWHRKDTKKMLLDRLNAQEATRGDLPSG